MSDRFGRIGDHEFWEIVQVVCACKICKPKWDDFLTSTEDAEMEYCESCKPQIKAISEKWKGVTLRFGGEEIIV